MPPADPRPKAVIFGCSGLDLTATEADFFRAENPLGFILFQRNCDHPAQVMKLVRDLRASVGRTDAPVLIDQEGGRVARLKPPHWRHPPSARSFAELYARDPAAALKATRLNGEILARDLLALGIDVDCAPVLDVPAPDGHDIIGDRAYGMTAAQVTALGRAMAEGLEAGGVIPILKHIPGHGRATADSHLELPRVAATAADLARIDFAPFQALRDFGWAMTAHILYAALDPGQPATTSPQVIANVIRGEIGFDGILISDDLGMQALGGDFAARAEAALVAGCDLVLHCSGDLAEMIQVAAGTRPITAATASRLARAKARVAGMSERFNRAEALAELAALAGRTMAA